MIKRYKDENASLKSELAHQTTLSQKYAQRSVRLREKISEMIADGGASDVKAKEEVERLQRALREAKFAGVANIGNVWYNMWRSECDKGRRADKKLAEAENKLETSEGEALQTREELRALTASSRSQSQKLQKRIFPL